MKREKCFYYFWKNGAKKQNSSNTLFKRFLITLLFFFLFFALNKKLLLNYLNAGGILCILRSKKNPKEIIKKTKAKKKLKMLVDQWKVQSKSPHIKKNMYKFFLKKSQNKMKNKTT